MKKKLLVATVGVGRDVDRSILMAVDQTNPTHVLLLASEDSLQWIEAITTQLQELDIPYTVDTFKDVEDVNHLVVHYLDQITRTMREHDFRPYDCHFDFTRGTKAMSAALVVCAVELRVSRISYITSPERESDTGRVIPGTEQFMTAQPNAILFRRDVEILTRHFNTYRFKYGLEMLAELSNIHIDPRIQQVLTFLDTLFHAFADWDAFHFRDACASFEKLKEYKAWLQQAGLFKAYECGNRLLHILIKKEGDIKKQLGILNVMLYTNALRRIEEGRYDTAVALMYRAIEQLAHTRLRTEYGYDASDLPLTSLPNELQQSWQPFAEKGTLKLGLLRSYELLEDLEDPLGKHFLDDYWNPNSDLRKGLNRRNMSVLAHSFHPTDDDTFRKLERWFLPVAREHIPRFDRYVRDATFPKLRAEPIYSLVFGSP